jgi:hypothetical protein
MNKGNCISKQNCQSRPSTKTISKKKIKKDNEPVIEQPQTIVEKPKYLHDRTKSIDNKNSTVKRNNDRNTKYNRLHM